MSSEHYHSHSHHSHGHSHDGKLTIAVFINILLTIAQIIGGLLSGSLSLIADAMHNLSDAGAIVIAIVARKIARKPADENMTFGYQRAEIIGAFVNSLTLIAIGFYLIYEAINKFINPTEINGWIVIWVAAIALFIDVATAILTYKSGAKDSMNIRAAFIHNVSDALASVAVIIAGVLIIAYQWYFVDLIATIGISFYVIYHGWLLVKQSTRVLMEAVPIELSISEVKVDIEAFAEVEQALDIHIFQLNENKTFLEAKILFSSCCDANTTAKIKKMLLEKHQVQHATIEAVDRSQQAIEPCYQLK